MTPRPPRVRPTMQLNLQLLQGPTYVIPDNKQAELVLALVELLIGAAHIGPTDGGDDESKTHR